MGEKGIGALALWWGMLKFNAACLRDDIFAVWLQRFKIL